MQRVERERHLDDVEARVALLEVAALHAHRATRGHTWGFGHGATYSMMVRELKG